MAVGPTYVDGLTGQVVKADVVDMLDGPVSLTQTSVSADDLWLALETLGLVVEP